MSTVVGLDGTPGGWAAIILDNGVLDVTKIVGLNEFLTQKARFQVVAIDTPIGLLDRYEVGGRYCDRAVRSILGKRGSSVFPAPVRPVLRARSYDEGCAISRSSGPFGKAITKQTFGILPKIIEVDQLLQQKCEFRSVIREVHPEFSFAELTGLPIQFSKKKKAGKDQRRGALRDVFVDFDAIELRGRRLQLPCEDIIDATIACWTASRVAKGSARCVTDGTTDSTGLSMAIWA